MNKVPENPSKNRKGDFTPLVVITAFLVTLYLIANLMAVKIISIGPLSLFDAGTITFPFAYMLGDVLAEVWGYRTARKVIILTFICNAMLVFFTSIGTILPYPEYMSEMQKAYTMVYTYVPRIVLASLISFLVGELANAKVLVRIKEKQKDDRHLWIRTIGSSAIGYLLDSVLFVLIAFTGTSPAEDILSMIVVQYLAKLLIEAIAGTPLAYAAVGYIKRKYL
ncbi:MAG: queuosine precursor transporter [Spirochaetes bacterium]|uniref:Probable queuosine precursor transporter n=1 Tax=Candidatus Ornithospirochaeta stercoripullorum TaxID=2840899 RepID=A0A9D9E276_9SPIO|nr:queuosine precursor transporter [Candidatus Ornithospirochaeta stercoripullorum]